VHEPTQPKRSAGAFAAQLAAQQKQAAAQMAAATQNPAMPYGYGAMDLTHITPMMDISIWFHPSAYPNYANGGYAPLALSPYGYDPNTGFYSAGNSGMNQIYLSDWRQRHFSKTR